MAFTFFTGHENKQQRTKVLLLTTLLFMTIGLMATLGYTLLPNLVAGIIFGQRFNSIAGLVSLVAIFGTAYSLANLFAQYYISREEPIAMLSLPFLIFQTVGIILFHQSFSQVLVVGILTTTCLFFSYLGCYGWKNQRVLGGLLQKSFKKVS